MRAHGRRTKKLIIAFHFQFSNPAAWKCDECRKNGLETKRSCGWVPEAEQMPARVVWARKKVSTTTCPRSVITGESVAWIEEFHAWKQFGWPEVRAMGAREAEAMLVLERELESERRSRRVA